MNRSIPFVDTNVFLRFLVYDKTTSELSKKAKIIFQKIQDKKLLVQTNICIVSELVYVLESYYEIDKDLINTPLFSPNIDKLVLYAFKCR